LSRVVSESVWSVGQCEGCIQMLVHGHRAARQDAAPADRLDLQRQVLKADGVVLVDCALELEGEDQVQILARAGQERGSALRRWDLKAAVELGHIVLGEKSVGRLQSADSMQSQLLRQSPLPGGEAAFRASPRLRRVGRNHMDPQLPQSAARLRQAVSIDLAARFRREPEMAAPV
jgi:hypothetical protein